ncbi:MAG: hypothetical protein ACRELD_02070 [Longimicrobiales bacterium]
MQRVTTVGAIMVLLTLWQSGCVDMPFAADSGSLSEADRVELGWALAEVAFEMMTPQSLAASASPSAGAVLVQGELGGPASDFSVIRGCPQGGELRVRGEAASVLNDLQNTVTEFGGDATPDDCGVDVRDRAVLLDADPSLETSGRLEQGAAGAVGEQRLTFRGGLIWSANGERGLCDVNLTTRWNASTDARSLHGHFCGVDMGIETAGSH